MLHQLRAEEAFQGVQLFGKLTIALVGWLSFARILFFVFLYEVNRYPIGDILFGFWMGLRFDVLVLGFLWIPFTLLIWGSSLWFSPRRYFYIFKTYWAILILVIFNLTWFDFFWMAENSTRLNSSFRFLMSMDVLEAGWLQGGQGKSLLVTFLLAVTCVGLLGYLRGLVLQKTFETPRHLKSMGRFLLTLLLVALAARGTITAHHLELAHAQISDDPLLNQLPLNAMWNMDKPPPQ